MSTKNETLLEKAKQVESKLYDSQTITNEHIELALAWAKGELSFRQVSKVLNYKSPSRVYSLLAFSLREHIKNQGLSIRKN